MPLVKAVSVKISVDGYEDAKLKMDELGIKADELSKDHPEITPQINSAKAMLQAAVLREGLKAELTKGMGAGAGGGLFERMLFGASGSGGVGNMLQFAGMPVLIAGATAAAAALVVEITGVVSGFAAAAQGVAAFGILAYPTFTKVYNAVTGVAGAMALLDPAQKKIVTGVQAIETEYKKLSTAFEPAVTKVIGAAIGPVMQILKDLPTFANPAAKAITGLLNEFNKFLASPGAQAFQNAMAKIEGPAITAIGKGIGQVAVSIGKLLTVLSAKTDARAITLLFDVISGAINGLAFVVGRLAKNWDSFSQQISHAFDNVKHAFDNFMHAFDNASHAVYNVLQHAFDNFMHALDNVSHAIGNVNHAFSAAVTGMEHVISTVGNAIGRFFTVDIPHWISIGVAWFHGLPGRILSAVGNLGNLLFSAGAAIIHGLIAGIQSAIGALGSVLGGIGSFIASHKGPMEVDRMLLYPNGQAIMGGLMSGIASQVGPLRNQLAGITGSIGVAGYAGGAPAYAAAGGAGGVAVPVWASTMIALLRQQVAATTGVGPDVARNLNSTGRNASQRSRYPAKG